MVGRQYDDHFPGEGVFIASAEKDFAPARMGHHGPQALYPGDPDSRARTPIEISPLALGHGRPDNVCHMNNMPISETISSRDHHSAGDSPADDRFDRYSGDVMPEPGLCAGCGERISDRYYLLAVEKPWHANCLRCAECKLTLDSELTCFAKDGSIYCKEDYYRRFALKRCSGCQQGISAQDLVMRARHLVYHLNCFTCAACHKMLTTGEHFGIHENNIFCRIHYESALQGDFIPGGIPLDFSLNDAIPTHHMAVFNAVGVTAAKGRPRKRKRHFNEFDAEQCGHLGNENDMLALCGPDTLALQSGRQKRMRTSFKHHQLRIMKSYFQLNHNPDAKDLKQLAQKTGLSKRVLQVWFQNARAKYRRNQLKQEIEKGEGSSPVGPDNSGPQMDDSNDKQNIQNNNNNTIEDLSRAVSPAYSENSTGLSDSGSRFTDYEQTLTSRYMPDSAMRLDASEPTALTEIFRTSFTAVN